MIKQVIEKILLGFLVALPIILTGVMVAYFLVGDKSKLELTLFGLGAIPIVLFLPSIFSKPSSGALHTSKVI